MPGPTTGGRKSNRLSPGRRSRVTPWALLAPLALLTLMGGLASGCVPTTYGPAETRPSAVVSLPGTLGDGLKEPYERGALVTPLGGALRRMTISGNLDTGKADRHGQLLDTAPIRMALILVSGPDLPEPVWATASVNSGRLAPVTLDLPQGPNRVVEVRGLADSSEPPSPFWVVRAIASLPQDASLSVDPSTTPAADVLLALRAAESPLELTLDPRALGRFVNRIVFGTADGSRAATMVTHPALIDTAALSQAIRASGNLPGATTGFARSPARFSGRIAGLLLGQVARVSLDDPVSDPVTTDTSGNFTIPVVFPGATLGITVSSEFYAASNSVVAPVPPGGQGSANLTLTGNFLKASLFPQVCDKKNATARFTQLPIRVLSVLPGTSRANSLGWTAAHLTAVEESLAAYENNFPGVLKFESTALEDDDPDLATALRRADIYLYWVEDGAHTWCGGNAIGCESPYQPGGSFPCEAAPTVVNRSYQAGVQIALNYNAGGGRLPSRVFWAVTEHEIGHALGLNHSQDPQDVMYPTVAFFGNNMTLARGDLNTIRFLYSLPANLTRDHAAFDLVPTYQNDGGFAYPDAPLPVGAQAFLNR